MQQMSPQTAAAKPTNSTATTLSMDGMERQQQQRHLHGGDEDGDCGLMVRSSAVNTTTTTDSEAEKIYDDPYELMLTDEWRHNNNETEADEETDDGHDHTDADGGRCRRVGHGRRSGSFFNASDSDEAPLQQQRRSWLCCPKSTSAGGGGSATLPPSMRANGGATSGQHGAEYTSLVTQQPLFCHGRSRHDGRCDRGDVDVAHVTGGSVCCVAFWF